MILNIGFRGGLRTTKPRARLKEKAFEDFALFVGGISQCPTCKKDTLENEKPILTREIIKEKLGIDVE